MGMDRLRQFIEENVGDSDDIRPDASVTLDGGQQASGDELIDGDGDEFEQLADEGDGDQDLAAADADEDEEFEWVEREWDGTKIRIDKTGDEFFDKYWTQKNQRMAAEHKARMAETEAREAEALAKLKAAQDLQTKLQAHLDANPEFAESWNNEVKVQQEQSLLQELQSKLEKLDRERRQNEALERHQRELAQLDSKYNLGNEEDQDLLRDLAFASWAKRGGQGSMEDDFRLAYSKLKGRSVKKQVRKAGRAAARKRSAPTSSTSSRGTPRAEPKKRKGLRALLSEHLSTPGLLG